jgi:hypothetical protein
MLVRTRTRVTNTEGAEVFSEFSEETFHVPTGIGKAMIHMGLAEEVVIRTFAEQINHDRKQRLLSGSISTKNPNTTWTVRDGEIAEDVLYPPIVAALCSTCKKTCQMTGPKSVQNGKFLHCHVQESVPEHIRKEYERRIKQYKSRG